MLTRLAILLSLFLLPTLADAKTDRRHAAKAEFMRENPCPATGKKRGRCPGWEVDHVVPLKCDGPDHKSNMQWLTVRDHKRKTAREAGRCRRGH